MPIQVAKDGSYKGFGGPQLVEHLQERQEELRLMAGYPSRSLLLCLRKNWVVVEHQSLLHRHWEVEQKDQVVRMAKRRNWYELQVELKDQAVRVAEHQNRNELQEVELKDQAVRAAACDLEGD